MYYRDASKPYAGSTPLHMAYGSLFYICYVSVRYGYRPVSGQETAAADPSSGGVPDPQTVPRFHKGRLEHGEKRVRVAVWSRMLRALPLHNDCPDLFCSLFELVRKHPPEAIPAEGLCGAGLCHPPPQRERMRGWRRSRLLRHRTVRVVRSLNRSKGDRDGGGVILKPGTRAFCLKAEGCYFR